MNSLVLLKHEHKLFICVFTVSVWNSRFQSKSLVATLRSSHLLVSSLRSSRSPFVGVRRPPSKQSTRTRKRTCRSVTLVDMHNIHDVTNRSTGPNALAILTALKSRTATVVVLDFDPFVVHRTRVGYRASARHADGLPRRAAPSVVHHLHHAGQQFRVFVR